MTRATALRAVREAVIKAVPEILELKFGCVVNNFLKGTAVILKVHKYEGESDCYDVAYYELPEMVVERTPFNNWEILGRPITLADVLLAIGFVQKRSSYYCEVGTGRFIKSKKIDLDTSKDTDTGIYWNLRKDSIEEQEDSTLSFLAELLDKK